MSRQESTELIKKKSDQLKELIFQHVSVVCVRVCVVKSDYVCSVHVPFS